MYQTLLYVLKDASYTADPEQIIAAGMVRKLSDAIDLQAANINDGGKNLSLVVSCKSTNAAVGSGYRLELVDCATVDGVYQVASAKFIPLASMVKEKEIWKVSLPDSLKRFIKLQVIPLSPDMVGNEMLITAAAASDSAAKVAGLIRAAAAQFLPNWVVTGATADVIFTAAANGVNTGTRTFDGGATGITGSIAVTTAGAAGDKAVYTLTVATACAATGYIRIELDKKPMTGGPALNAAVICS